MSEHTHLMLHWSPRSPFVRKVMIAAHEVGASDHLHLERTTVAMSKPHAGLMRDNPLSKLPTLVVTRDGRRQAFFDSRVICEWLDDMFAKAHLLPQLFPERLDALRLEALGDGMLDILLLWFEERLKSKELRSEPHMRAFRDKFWSSLGYLESNIALVQDFPFNVGHISIGCALSYADFRFASEKWRNAHTALAKWHAGFCARASVIANPVVDDLEPSHMTEHS